MTAFAHTYVDLNGPDDDAELVVHRTAGDVGYAVTVSERLSIYWRGDDAQARAVATLRRLADELEALP